MVKEVETILQQEFCCYRYKNIWDELKHMGLNEDYYPGQRRGTQYDGAGDVCGEEWVGEVVGGSIKESITY